MATSTTRTSQITTAGDDIGQINLTATPNPSTPRPVDVVSLASGANTITVPTSGTSLPYAVTIVPPAGNATSIILKGVTGDTGVRIHNSDHTTIALDPSVTSFVLTAGAAIQGVRLFWS
jgi:hypothetical protein